MGDATKTEALKNSDTLYYQSRVSGSVPRFFRSWSTSDDLVGNVRRAEASDWELLPGRFFWTVDRADWGMRSADQRSLSMAVCAIIVFPAGILTTSGIRPQTPIRPFN